MRESTLITESRIEECGIVAQVVKRAPRACGDDPVRNSHRSGWSHVLPAHAGMILSKNQRPLNVRRCSPRMRG